MREKVNISAKIALAFVLVSSPAWGFDDQHDVKYILAALQSPIPLEAVTQAQAMDDRILSAGDVQGQKVYLVTDSRSQRVNALVRRLLAAMGQEEHEWTVRVLDTQPPTVNAFVFGGKYIYVYTGLLKEAASDDELAVVLGHELGHSLLKHNLRKQQDTTNTLAEIAEVIGALAGGKKGQDKVSAVTNAIRASYSRTDEEEADALGVAISRRAGFDPLRGADFFSRMAKRANDEEEKVKQLLGQARGETEQAIASCQQWVAAANANPFKRSQAQAVCNDAEQKRLAFNQTATQYQSERRSQQLYGDHPTDQNRIAVVAALSDFLNGRRSLESLRNFQQSYRVMSALKQTDSVLLRGTEPQVSPGGIHAEKAKPKEQLPGDPTWLDRQRIVAESQRGQQATRHLQTLKAERQKQVHAWDEKLKAMQGKIKEQSPPNQQDVANFKEEVGKYQAFIGSTNAEIKARIESLTEELNNVISQALLKLTKQDLNGSDPTPALIRIVDQGQDSKSTASGTTGQSIADQLKQLKLALDEGLLTEEEYQAKRKQVLERF
jgi:predicted Zn-dependent protease